MATNVFTTKVGVLSPSHTITGPISGNANVGTVSGNLGLRAVTTTYTDNVSAAAATGNFAIHAFSTPTLTAANAITPTNLSTFYIQGSPTAGTNVTVSGGAANTYSLYVAGGNSFFNGNITANYFIGNGSQLTSITANVANLVAATTQITGTYYLALANTNTTTNVSINSNTNINVAVATGTLSATLFTGTLTTAAQPNITSVSTSFTTLTFANAQSISGNNLTLTTGSTSNLGTLTGNFTLSAGSLLRSSDGSSSNVLYGNGSFAPAPSASFPLTSGASNINVASSGGNLLFTANGVANILTIANNASVGQVQIAGTLTTTGNANVPNLTVGSGTGGSLTGANLISANYLAANSITISGAVSSTVNVAATLGNLGIRTVAATYTDTAATGTQANAAIHYIDQPTITGGTNAKTYTNMSTFYIANVPLAGTNATITNSYALFVANGNSFFGGNVTATTFVGALSGTATSATTASNATNVSTTLTSTGTSFIPFISATATNNYPLQSNANFSANLANGYITATGFVGNANAMTSIPAANVTGTLPNAVTNAISNVGTVSAGSIAGSLITGNVANATIANVANFHVQTAQTTGTYYLSLANTNTSTNVSLNANANINVAVATGTLSATVFAGSGASLTSLPAANVTGTLPTSVTNAISNIGTLTAGSIPGTLVTGTVPAATTAGTVTTAAQPNITSVSTSFTTLTFANAQSISGNNITITTGSSTNTGTLTGNFTLSAGSLLRSSDGNSSNVLYGNGSFATAPGASASFPLTSGASNINVSVSGGNLLFTANGVANILTIANNAGNGAVFVNIANSAILANGANGVMLANSHTISGAVTGTVNVAATLGNLGLRTVASTYTDVAATGTQANAAIHYIDQPTITGGTNAKTYTNMSTFYIANAPLAGTNATITNSYALFIANGNSFFGGNILGNVNGNPIGYRNVPANVVSTGNYQLPLADIGKFASYSVAIGNVIVPNSTTVAFNPGDTITVFNNTTGSQTVNVATGVTLYLSGTSSTGNRTLSTRGLISIMNVGTNAFVITGSGLT